LFFMKNHKIPNATKTKNPDRNKSAEYKLFLSSFKASTNSGP
jgi:hypothetical protein